MITQQNTGQRRFGRACRALRAVALDLTPRLGRADLAPALPEISDLCDFVGIRVAQLRTWDGIEVTVDTLLIPEECLWCAGGQLATVRVIGTPAPNDPHHPLLTALVCHRCAMNPRTSPIRQALAENGSTAPIQVQVCE